MSPRKEFEFAEIMVDRLFLESFAEEQSAYHHQESDQPKKDAIERFRGRVIWHINHSLSPRQKQVLTQFLSGRKEREIATNMGVTQQVVHIHKWRGIKRLRELMKP